MEPEQKPFYLSKTVIFSILVAIAGIVPASQEWVASHPETTLVIVGLIGVGLRFITNGRVVVN